MGCYSSQFNKLWQTPQYQEWNNTFRALQITKSEVAKLHAKFQKVDLDNGGTIDVVELLTVIDVERTAFTERVFSIFDEDKSGKIDFYEFVLSLWNYCTLSRVTLAMFAFDLYDRDSSGFLEEKDIYLMLKDIYGKDMNSHYAKQTRKDLEDFVEQKGDIDLDRFLKFVQYHHSLLFPAFQMQLALKQSVLGVRFWEKASDRRVRLSLKKYVTIKEILEMQALKETADSMKGLLVSTNTGKLAIRSIGLTHNRRTKYDDLNKSSDSQDATHSNTADNSHGNSHISLNSLLPSNPGAVHPETVGMISAKMGNNLTGGHRPSVKSSAKTHTDLLDHLMNPHASNKSAVGTHRSHDSHSHDPPSYRSGKDDHNHHHHNHHHHGDSRKDHHHGSRKDHHHHGSNKDHQGGSSKDSGKLALSKLSPASPRLKSPPSLPPTFEEKTSAKEDIDLVMENRKSKAPKNGTGNSRIEQRRKSL